MHTQSFQQAIRTTAGRVEVELVNVFGLLPARGGVEGARTFVVSGHYDSINGDHADAVGPAPGADDDASGTALVLELARVLSAASFDANLVFLCVPGEEQGLFGSSHFAETLGGLDLNIAGMFTNDIVGGAHDAEFEQDFGHVRVFAGGGARGGAAGGAPPPTQARASSRAWWRSARPPTSRASTRG